MEAFGELVERLREPIQRQCRQRVGNWHDAEDLAQEAFVRAWLKLDQLGDPSCFAHWLRRIAANLCRDFLRNPARREIAGELPDVPDAARHLADLPLASLPEETRRCVMLFYQGGCSYAEIARALGSTVPAVKARLGRAKAILRKEMGTMDERERSPFTRRVLEKLEELQSDESEQRARAAGDLQQGLADDRYARLLGYLRGEPFPPKWMPPNTPPEKAEWTEWETAVNIRASIRAARRYRTPEMRDALIALLKHQGREVRLAAVGGLLSQGDPAAIPALRQAIDDPENPREVVDAAKSAIKRLERLAHPPAPDLEPRRLREELARAAGDKHARVELMQSLITALRDPSGKVRSRTAKALGELGDRRAALPLAALLRDPVSGVRQAAATALGALKSRQAVPGLMHYVEASTDIRSDLPALVALRDIGDPQALPAVLHALEHGPFYLAGIINANDVIPALATRENLPLIAETMARMEKVYRSLPARPDDRTAPNRVTVKNELQRIYGNSLARVADERDITVLLDAFDLDPHNPALAEALARLADPTMPAPMRRHLLAGHAGAAEVLAVLGQDGLAAFKEALRSPRADVRKIAAEYLFLGRSAEAMRKLADEELLGLLDDLAHDPSSSIRINALAAVRRIRKPEIWEHLQGKQARKGKPTA